MGDGGKWVCGMSRYEKKSRPCVVYSFGVQNESSFGNIPTSPLPIYGIIYAEPVTDLQI